MSIKSKLFSIVTIVITISLAIVVVRQITTAQITQTTAINQKSEAIVRGVFGLNNLLNDYLLYHTDRAKSQWLLEQKHIDILLATQQYINADDESIQRKLIEAHNSNSVIFPKLIQAYQNGSSQDLQDRLVSQLLIQSQSMVDNSIILSSRASAEEESIRDSARNIINVLTAILILSVILLLFLFYKSIIGPITKLSEASLQVGTGNWDYRVNLESKDEFEELAKAFNAMTAKVNRYIKQQEKMEKQKDNFIASASHELKTPLTSIKMFAEVMQQRFVKSGDTKSAELTQKFNTQLNRLSSLINDLLDINKVDHGQLLYTMEDFDMNTLIREVVQEMQQTTSSHTIIQNLAKEGAVYGDRNRIAQVLVNLLSNAIKYSPNARRIIITTKIHDRTMLLSVRDFGIGIAKKDLGKIFKRFFRVEEPFEQTYPGMGLGLYISKEIITRHKGHMWIKSEKGKGSIFSFSLPLRKII